MRPQPPRSSGWLPKKKDSVYLTLAHATTDPVVLVQAIHVPSAYEYADKFILFRQPDEKDDGFTLEAWIKERCAILLPEVYISLDVGLLPRRGGRRRLHRFPRLEAPRGRRGDGGGEVDVRDGRQGV